jgi:hypothetical protein
MSFFSFSQDNIKDMLTIDFTIDKMREFEKFSFAFFCKSSKIIDINPFFHFFFILFGEWFADSDQISFGDMETWMLPFMNQIAFVCQNN